MVKFIHQFKDDGEIIDVEVSNNRDDLTMVEMKDLFIRFALASGYHRNTVEEYLGDLS